jgi:16S rRNA (cytosine967-C5)-methyltransferase
VDAALRKEPLSAQDRGLVTDLVYGSLRREITLDACLRPLLKAPEGLPPEVLDALRLGSYERLFRETAGHAAVNEWVEVVKAAFPRLAGLANAVLRRVTLQEGLDEATAAGLPGWLYQEWQGLFGPDRAARLAASGLTPQPLWLLLYRPEARASLEAEGAELTDGPLADTVAVRSPKPLVELSAFKRGWVQAQNPSSTVPTRLLEVKAGERVLDLAGGGGVKAAQLAAAGAAVTSLDLFAKKAERGRANLRRLGLEATFLSHDLRTLPALEPAAKVLLDAPCTGTGTLRGHPELRTRVTEEAVHELAALQRELLATAAMLTRPGGRLVYAVCALTRAETVDNVRWFLDAQPDFRLIEPEPPLPAEETAGETAEETAEGTFLLPLGGLDGFFISVFERVC